MSAERARTARILVVEDDPTVAEVVSRFLRRDGYRVDVAMDGSAGLARALADPPDLLILDRMLPGMDGLEVCRRLHQTVRVPVIMLTALADEAERVAGLEIGADDYLTKPFSARELLARVRAVLRRAAGPPPLVPLEVLRAGDLEVDTRTREVRRDGALISLTAKEFDLLLHLVRHPRRVFRREELLGALWARGLSEAPTVTVHIRRLREKIERNPSEPVHVQTVWGVGYRFEP